MKKRTDQPISGKSVGAVENAVLILRHLAHSPVPQGVAAVARDAGVNVSTAFNILRTLVHEGLVAFDPEDKTYRLGLGVLEFSAPLLGLDQIELIRPELRPMSETHGALIALWKITADDRIVLVDKLASARAVRIDVAPGARLPAFVGAVGRCVAATRGLAPDALRAEFDRLRWQAPPRFEDYAADVARAATDGYAFDRGQLFRGVDIAASVVRDHRGGARFGVSGIAIAGQLSETELHRLGQALRDGAERISRLVFGRAQRNVNGDAA